MPASLMSASHFTARISRSADSAGLRIRTHCPGSTSGAPSRGLARILPLSPASDRSLGGVPAGANMPTQARHVEPRHDGFASRVGMFAGLAVAALGRHRPGRRIFPPESVPGLCEIAGASWRCGRRCRSVPRRGAAIGDPHESMPGAMLDASATICRWLLPWAVSSLPGLALGIGDEFPHVKQKIGWEGRN